MCGRYTLRVSPAELAEVFEVLNSIEWEPRFNIAPTQTVPTVRPVLDGNGRELALVKWGLVPYWADDPKMGSRLINARAESVATKPAFRSALRKKRCLVPADGFYEWQAVPGQKTKQPFRMAGGGVSAVVAIKSGSSLILPARRPPVLLCLDGLHG